MLLKELQVNQTLQCLFWFKKKVFLIFFKISIKSILDPNPLEANEQRIMVANKWLEENEWEYKGNYLNKNVSFFE